jgi:hypothetical protein
MLELQLGAVKLTVETSVSVVTCSRPQARPQAAVEDIRCDLNRFRYSALRWSTFFVIFPIPCPQDKLKLCPRRAPSHCSPPHPGALVGVCGAWERNQDHSPERAIKAQQIKPRAATRATQVEPWGNGSRDSERAYNCSGHAAHVLLADSCSVCTYRPGCSPDQAVE